MSNNQLDENLQISTDNSNLQNQADNKQENSQLPKKRFNFSIIKSIFKSLGIIILSIFCVALLFFGLGETSNFLRSNDYKTAANLVFMLFPVLVYFLVILVNKKINKLSLNEMGFGYKNIFKAAAIGLLLSVGIATLSLLIAKFVFNIPVNLVGLQDGFQTPLINLLINMFLVGLWEEFFFRGLVFNTLHKNKFGLHGAAIVSSLMFSIIHYGSFDMPITWYLAIFLIGYIYSLIYKITNSIWSVAIAHFAWNFFAFLIDDKENKIGLIAVNDYASNEKIIGYIIILLQFLALLLILYIMKRKGSVAVVNKGN